MAAGSCVQGGGRCTPSKHMKLYMSFECCCSVWAGFEWGDMT
jgi:hypothetical protein